jgi:uncharacterized membrane protein
MLADVIFALGVVQIVLAVDYPDPAVVKSDAAIAEYVKAHLRDFGLYAVSLILVAVYWMKHVEHFGHYRDATPGFLWLQVLYLMFVAVVPIANTMNSLFAGSFAVHAAYAANIFFIGIFSYFT